MPELPRTSPVRAGEAVPEFAAATATGTPFARSELLGKTTVLYFYPKANSLGCSMEAREFAKHVPEFEALGASIVGVSVDTAGDQQKFQETCSLPFPLVADADRSVSRAFGVLGMLGVAKRVTFVVGPDGKVLDVIDSWRPGVHTRAALKRLRRDRPGAAPAPTSGQ